MRVGRYLMKPLELFVIRVKGMDIDQIVKAVEDDAGHPVDGLRESLAEGREGRWGRIYTLEQSRGIWLAEVSGSRDK